LIYYYFVTGWKEAHVDINLGQHWSIKMVYKNRGMHGLVEITY